MKDPNHSYTQASMRGLAALGDRGVRRVDSFRVDPRVLNFDEGFNVRVKDAPELLEHIASIKQAIKSYITRDDPENRVCVGGLTDLFPALVVRIREDGQIAIVEGHCRTTAIRELIAEGFDIREVDVKATTGDAAARTLIMIRSAQAKGLDPIEKAFAYKRFADDFGWSFPAIAGACGGVTTQRVEQLLLLANGPQEIIDMVLAKSVTADTAIEIIRANRKEPDKAVGVLQGLVSRKGQRPVGKGSASVSIPRKAQNAFFSAFTANGKELAGQLDAVGKNEGWEAMPVTVKLPAGVVQQLLDLQSKGKGQQVGA